MSLVGLASYYARGSAPAFNIPGKSSGTADPVLKPDQANSQVGAQKGSKESALTRAAVISEDTKPLPASGSEIRGLTPAVEKAIPKGFLKSQEKFDKLMDLVRADDRFSEDLNRKEMRQIMREVIRDVLQPGRKLRYPSARDVETNAPVLKGSETIALPKRISGAYSPVLKG